MSIFDNAINIVKNELNKVMNKSIMEATMAATAMVSSANGLMKDSELQALYECISANKALKDYDPIKLQEIFNEYYKTFQTMKFAATSKVMGVLKKVKKGSEDAYVLVGVCCEIANADGEFDNNEKKYVKQICDAVGVKPQELNLVL